MILGGAADADIAEQRRPPQPASPGLTWESCRASLGTAISEALGRTALAAAIEEADRPVLATGSGEHREQSFARSDRGERTWLAAKSALRDEDGQVIGLGGAAQDITARKRAELRDRRPA